MAEDLDPVNAYIESVKQQMVKKIDNRYSKIDYQLSRLLRNEEYCLSVFIGMFTTATALMSSGLKVGKKEMLMSNEEGKIELKRRIRKHVKLAEWLKGRKEREIGMALKRFDE